MFSDSHEELFDKIYDASVFTMDVSIMSDTEKRHLFESTRRYLDICRVINKSWPLTNRLVCAKEGRDIILDVFNSLHKKVSEYSTVHEGCLAVYRDVVTNIDNGKYSDLLEMESTHPTLDDIINALSNNENDDILSLLFSLAFYHRSSAHDSLYRGLLINGQ